MTPNPHQPQPQHEYDLAGQKKQKMSKKKSKKEKKSKKAKKDRTEISENSINNGSQAPLFDGAVEAEQQPQKKSLEEVKKRRMKREKAPSRRFLVNDDDNVFSPTKDAFSEIIVQDHLDDAATQRKKRQAQQRVQQQARSSNTVTAAALPETTEQAPAIKTNSDQNRDSTIQSQKRSKSVRTGVGGREGSKEQQIMEQVSTMVQPQQSSNDYDAPAARGDKKRDSFKIEELELPKSSARRTSKKRAKKSKKSSKKDIINSGESQGSGLLAASVSASPFEGSSTSMISFEIEKSFRATHGIELGSVSKHLNDNAPADLDTKRSALVAASTNLETIGLPGKSSSEKTDHHYSRKKSSKKRKKRKSSSNKDDGAVIAAAVVAGGATRAEIAASKAGGEEPQVEAPVVEQPSTNMKIRAELPQELAALMHSASKDKENAAGIEPDDDIESQMAETRQKERENADFTEGPTPQKFQYAEGQKGGEFPWYEADSASYRCLQIVASNLMVIFVIICIAYFATKAAEG